MKRPSNPSSPTEETVQNGKGLDEAHERVIDWYAAEGMVCWDVNKIGVVRRPSITALAEELGISRQTVYNWAKTLPGFEQRKDKAKEAIMFQNTTALWNIIYLKACSGNVRAAELYLSTFDANYVSPRHKARRTEPEPTGLAELVSLVTERKRLEKQKTAKAL